MGKRHRRIGLTKKSYRLCIIWSQCEASVSYKIPENVVKLIKRVYAKHVSHFINFFSITFFFILVFKGNFFNSLSIFGQTKHRENLMNENLFNAVFSSLSPSLSLFCFSDVGQLLGGL